MASTIAPDAAPLSAALVIGVGQKPHLDEHGGHVGADEQPQRRLHRGRAYIGTLRSREVAARESPPSVADRSRERHLRQLPRHDVDHARAAADDRHRRAPRDRLAAALVVVEAERQHLRAADGRRSDGIGVQADEADRPCCCSRTPCARRRGTLSSPSRVSSTRSPIRLSMAALAAGAPPAASGPFPSRRPRRCAPVVVAAVTRVDDDRADAGQVREIRQRRGFLRRAAGPSWRGGGARGWRGSGGGGGGGGSKSTSRCA